MNKSKVSVIIPYYKKKKYIVKTLYSVLNQTHRNLEVIIIYDDKNLDDLKFIKKEIKGKKNIRIFKNNQNIGVGLSRNKGIKISKGKYIAFCDADDLWKKNKVEYQIKIMKNKKLNFFHSNYNIIDSNDKKIGQFEINNKIRYNDLLKSCDIGLSTVIISKKLLNKHKFCKLKTKEDYNLWLDIIKKEKIFFGTQKILTSWRETNNSLSSSSFQKIKDAYSLYNHYQKFNSLISSFYVIKLIFFAFIKKLKIYV